MTQLDGAALVERVLELESARRRLDAIWLETLAAFDRSRAWEADASTSAGAWLATATNQDHARASAQVRTARRLERMPLVARALGEGRISAEHARALADAADVPEFPEAEAVLVQHASELRPAATRRVVEHWRAVVGHEAGRPARDRRRLHLATLLDGMRALDGLLDRDDGAIVERALDDLMVRSSDCPGEPSRSRSQRRADALVDLCDRYLRGATGAGNRRPQLLAVADFVTLEQRAGRSARLGNGERLDPDALRRLACDAAVSRVLTDPEGLPLDVGRTTRVVPPALRRALDVRDAGCTFPGCDRPPDWCDAHHVRHWADGGETRLDNLALVCRRHHTLLHEHRVRMEPGPGGRPRWRRADGGELPGRPRPPPGADGSRRPEA